MGLRVGVVGLSGIGRRHARCYAQDPLAELVAVCDIAGERAEAAATELGVRSYHSLDAMLASEPDLQIVDVTTGGHENGSWHCGPVMQALGAGRHVLVEKPLSNDITEARRMVARADELGLYLGCNLNHYFTPPAEQARELITEGRCGEVRYCLMKMSMPGGEPGYTGAPADPRVRDYPYFHAKAFLTHPFSVMRYLCGDVSQVSAVFSRPGFRQSAGDVLLSQTSIHLGFVSGCTGYMLTTRGDTPTGLGGWWSVEVGGTRGTLCIENCIERLTFWPAAPAGERRAPEPVVTESGLADFSATFGRRLHAFLEDVAAGVPRSRLRGSGRDALAALEYTFAAMASHERGGLPVRPRPLPPVG